MLITGIRQTSPGRLTVGLDGGQNRHIVHVQLLPRCGVVDVRVGEQRRVGKLYMYAAGGQIALPDRRQVGRGGAAGQ